MLGDTAHYFQAPGANDIRGPCPGLNTAANHNFLAHDGITTFSELVDAQQNVYGVGYDLAVLLAALGVGLDGDLVTEKLSLGCDATTRTAVPGLGPEVGLDGHNKFEGDSSLTRNDYFTAGGDDYTFNQTLYNDMLSVCNGNCNLAPIAQYRYQRYQWSLNHNGNFYFGPKSLLLFGAASFLYYTILDVGSEIFKQYELHPVAFGANTGKPNSFVGIGQHGPYFSNNMFSGTAAGVSCALYQLATENDPASLGGGGILPIANLEYMASKLNPIFGGNGSLAGLACPLNFNSA